jgi:hypothetical protein
MMATSTVEYRTYGSWRRPRSAGVAGLTFGTTMLGIAGIVVLMLIGLLFGFGVAGIAALLAVLAFTPLVISVDGRSGYERSLIMWQFSKARRRGEHVYASGAFSRIPGGRYRLPGVLAETECYEAVDAQNRRFGMIHMPSKHCYTVVLEAHPQGGENFDQDTLDQAVANWGAMLAAAGMTGDIAGIAATVETLPQTGIELYETVSRQVRTDAPQLARDAMYQLATGLTQGSLKLTARIAITFVAQTAARRKDWTEQAVEIARRLPEFTSAAARAGVPATPMTANEVMGFVRRSYEPGVLEDIERALMSDDPGLEWADCGPRTQLEEKGHLVHDGAISATWEMRSAPAGSVFERVLQRLVEPNPELPVKRVTIIYRPHSAADAAHTVDSDYRDALAAITGSSGLAKAQAELDVQATAQSRIAQARGHGLVRFGLLVTVTQPDDTADIPRIDALVRDLAHQCRLVVHRAHYWQAAAFAASLGVGVIPPDHSTIPSMLAG